MRAMTLYRNNPWELFDSLFEAPKHSDGYSAVRPSTFTWDLGEREGYYILNVDLPGVKREDLQIEVKDNILTVSGERKDRKMKVGYETYGKFEKSFTLPDGVNFDKIEAHYEDGVLQIAIPKEAEKKTKRIEIATGEKQAFFSKLVGDKNKKDDEAA